MQLVYHVRCKAVLNEGSLTMMSDKSYRAMRRAAGWNIAAGVSTLVVGIAVGVGCIVAGGMLLSRSCETEWIEPRR